MSFYDKMTCLVDEGKGLNLVYLNFSKAFDTISHKHFLRETGCLWLGWVCSSVGKNELR